MKNILELNIEIEKMFNPEIIYYNLVGNIAVNQTWINEIDKSYFDVYEKHIKEKIDLIADLDSNGKINFLKIFHQDILQKYKEQLSLNFSDLEYLKSITKIYIRSIEAPKEKTNEISFSADDSQYEEILEKLAELFKIEDFNIYGDTHGFFEYKNVMDEKLLDIVKNEDLGKLVPTVDDFGLENLFGLDGEFDEDYGLSPEEYVLGRYYSYAYLSLFLESNRSMLERLANYMEYLIVLVEKVEGYGKDKLTLEDINEGDPNKLKFELKLNKLEVSILFKNLSDFGYIEVDNRGQKHPFTQLKKYIDNANMYYLNEKGEAELINNISKEFSKVYGKKERVMHIDREIKFLENLIIKSKEKVAQIKSEEL